MKGPFVAMEGSSEEVVKWFAQLQEEGMEKTLKVV